MKLLTVSDNILPQMENPDNLRQRFGDVEAVVSCGDMPPPYLELITSAIGSPLYYVRGNHDIYYAEGLPGGDNLHMRIVRVKGKIFAGLEGCIRYNREPIQYTEGEMARMVLMLCARVYLLRVLRRREIDLMVTHSPPRGIHDLPDRAHWGFRSFILLLNVVRPRYLIHGHVDTYDKRRQWETTHRNTKIININPVKVIQI